MSPTTRRSFIRRAEIFICGISSPCIDTGDNTQAAGSTDLDGNPRIVGSAVDMGAYEFHGGTHYVNINNPTPVAPYADWNTAATNIQDAIDASSDGDLIMVTNGIYQSAGETVKVLASRTRWRSTNRCRCKVSTGRR